MIANKAQAHYRQNSSKRDIILKARQLGFSTEKLLEYLDDTITNKNVNTAIIAHTKEKVQTLFEIVKLAYKHLPDLLRPRVSFDNRNELYFPDINSKIYVTIDTRSEMVHDLHISELAFMKRAEDVLLAAFESVPDTGTISIESTANGMSGAMYEIWQDEQSEFKKHFYNWLWDDTYRLATHKTFDELKAEYKSLALEYGLIQDAVKRFNLDKEQLNFYILKTRRHRRKVKQEYPLTAEEAFLAAGRNVFSDYALQKHQAISPIDKKWGDVSIWEYPLKGFNYVIGCDPSEGTGNDNAVIEVINAYTGYQAAEFARNDVPPNELGNSLLAIASFYNHGLIVPEINFGLSTLDKIKTTYYNIYSREVFDKRIHQKRTSLGWRTTGTSKPKLVSDLDEAMREGYITINSAEALKECRTFVKTENAGRYGFGAEGTKKDDRVIALGLCIQGVKYLPSFKPPKTEAEIQLERWIEEKQLSKHFSEQEVSRVINGKYRPYYKIRGLNNVQ